VAIKNFSLSKLLKYRLILSKPIDLPYFLMIFLIQEAFHPSIGRPDKVIHVNLSYGSSVSNHGFNSSKNRSRVFNGDRLKRFHH
jgi:hypothetical protein